MFYLKIKKASAVAESAEVVQLSDERWRMLLGRDIWVTFLDLDLHDRNTDKWQKKEGQLDR